MKFPRLGRLRPDITEESLRFFRSGHYYIVYRPGLSFLDFTTRLDVQMILSDGENAAIFYEMETTRPARAVTFVGEWHQIRDGKIVRARAACDGRPFAALFPASS